MLTVFLSQLCFFLRAAKEEASIPWLQRSFIADLLSKNELAELKMDLESVRAEFNSIPADGFDINAFGVDEENTRLLFEW